MLEDIMLMGELASQPYFITNVLPFWVAFAIAIVALLRWSRW